MDWLRLRHRIPPPPPPSTLTNPHPSFSVTEDRVLDLRETSSQIVIQTIESALRQGGLALLGEGFQLDSSLSYHSGDNEGIEGDLDVVIPLWNGGRHAIFTQPGFVFWTGIEKEERIDGNIGLVYRAEITRDLIAGASVFYDHDFQIGHSRVGGGIDLQSGFFRFGANYYHVLSEIEDGREGFVEEAVDGMDARLVFEREDVRLGSTIGYWDYEGEESSGGENSQSGWKTSIGMDFGFRVLPGVFIEGSWERHKDNLVLDERIFAGLAFRFSLPEFEGASYGDGSMSANLYKIVDREKRILYEERVKGPSVSLSADSTSLTEEENGNTATITLTLSEPLAEDVTINLVGSGSATYNDDYTVSVGGTDCPMVTRDNCQVTITAGETSTAVEVSVNDDGGGEDAENIILSMVIASTGDPDLRTLGPLTLNIPADPLPTVSMSRTNVGMDTAEGGTETITLTLSEALTGDATFNLIGSGGATYGTSADWNISVGGTDCASASQSNPCEVTISAGDTTAEVTVAVNTDTDNELSSETFTISVTVGSTSTSIVQEGSTPSLNFTIPAELPTVSLNYSGNTTVRSPGNVTIPIELSAAVTEDIIVNIAGDTGTASYGGLTGWVLNPRNSGNADCSMVSGTNCQAMIRAGDTSRDLTLTIVAARTGQTIILSISIDSGSKNLVQLGSTSSVELTIQ